MESSYILYGTDHSYYTGKIGPYLRYKGIPYQEKLSTLWVYQRIILPRTGVKFIPVLHTPDDMVVQDTTAIIDFLEQRFPDRPIYPSTPKQKLVALLVELYADEWFTLPAMHYRWSYLAQQEHYVMEAFGDVAGAWLPAKIKRVIGRKIARPFKRSLKPLGITAATIPEIEAWYTQFLGWFNTHLEQYPYLLGSRPCIGDFALAGPMYAHLWRDPVPKQLLKELAPNVIDWIERINRPAQKPGTFLTNDEVPESLVPMLMHLFKEHWPVLKDTANYLPTWLAANPQKKHISRVIGEHQFKVGKVTEKRLLFPYSQWMMQRPLNHYQALSATEQQLVNQLLAQCGGVDAMSFKVPTPVERKNNRLMAVN